MEGVKAICQFCLQQTLPIATNNSVENMVKTFFPFKDNKIKNSSICPSCNRKLESVYRFAQTANENNSKILDATIESDDEVCQTCLNPVANPRIFLYYHFENVAPFSVIQKMLKDCLIKLDLGYRRNPIMCDVCWDVLQTSYRFLVKCAHMESKIVRFCRQQKLATIGVGDLKKFNEYNADIPGTCNEILFLDVCSNVLDNRYDVKKNAAADDIFSELRVEMEEKTIRRAVKVETESDTETAEFIGNVASEFVPVCGKPMTPLNDIVSIKIEEDSAECDNVERGYESSITVDNDESCRMEENDVKKLYVNLERTDLKVPKKRVKKKSERKPYQCQLCPYSTMKIYTYKLHLTTHMTLAECAKKNMLFHCDKCSYKSKRKYGLDQHVRRIHERPQFPKPAAEENEPKLNKCDKIILKCSHCKYETKSYAHLDEHAFTHKTTRAKKVYKCEVCGYEVKKKSGITRHVVIHSSLWELSKFNKLLKCDTCGFKAKRKDCLVQHMNKHRKSKTEKEGRKL